MTTPETQTLQDQRYKMPSEWARHAATWLQWPQPTIYPWYEMKLERLWLMMVSALCEHENVNLIVADEAQREHLASQLRYHRIPDSRVRFYLIPTEDVWVRDNGPIYLIDQHGKQVISDWTFNGWGGRFEHEMDNKVPAGVAKATGLPLVAPPLTMEGGAVEVDGKGTFMATRSSIITPNRNPGLDQQQIEGVISQYFDIERFIWLTGAGPGVCEQWGDTTDSHIDLIARFTPQKTILYSQSDDTTDPRYEMHRRHFSELKQQVEELGLDYELVPLPEPEGGVYQVSGEIDWRDSILADASYTNYYVANNVVLVPVYGNKNDQNGLAIIREQFPDREVIGLDSVAITEHGGAIHCVTQQQPLVHGEIDHD